MCPKGVDPLTRTLDTAVPTIKIVLTASTGSLNGTLQFSFNGESFLFPANSSLWDDYECETSFRSLPNINNVECTKVYSSSGTEQIYYVKFLSFPTFPYENNIFENDGTPSLSSFSCSAARESRDRATNVNCAVSLVGQNSTYPGERFGAIVDPCLCTIRLLFNFSIVSKSIPIWVTN